MSVETNPPAKAVGRRWRRFSIRALLTLTIAAAVCLTLCRREMLRYERELEIVRRLGWKLRSVQADVGFDWLATMRRKLGPPNAHYEIRGVTFNEYNVSDDDLRLAAKLTRLKRLEIYPGGYSAAAFSELLSLPELEVVSIVFPKRARPGVINLSSHGGQYLHPPGIGSETADWPALEWDPELDRFELGEAHFAGLAQAKRLRNLNVQGMPARPTFLEKLGGVPLESLTLAGTLVDDEIIASAPDFPGLKELNLEGSLATGRGLSRFTALNHLSLNDSPVSAEGLAEVLGRGRFNYVSLANAPIDDAMIAGVPPTATVAMLDLSGAQVSGVGLARFSNLSALYLSGAPLTRAGMEEIRTLPKLVELNVCNVPLSDEDLAILAEGPSLARLEFTSPAITQKTLDRLKAARPTLQIYTPVTLASFDPLAPQAIVAPPNFVAPPDSSLAPSAPAASDPP